MSLLLANEGCESKTKNSLYNTHLNFWSCCSVKKCALLNHRSIQCGRVPSWHSPVTPEIRYMYTCMCMYIYVYVVPKTQKKKKSDT